MLELAKTHVVRLSSRKWPRNDEMMEGGERPDALRITALRELSSGEMEDKQVA